MRKIILLVLSGLIVSACSTDSNEAENQIESIEIVDQGPEGGGQSGELQNDEVSGPQATYLAEHPRLAWTDYSAYAQPNEEGYAYYIHADPDISSEIFPLTEGSSHEVLLFTFDDAPQMPDSYALEIAQILKKEDVNAIFLVNGMYLESEYGREMTKTIHDMGFEIGNHTHTHPNLRELSYEDQYYEIAATNQMIEEITGHKVRWFRPPFGLFDMDTILICNELGLQLMTWSFGYDWMDEYLSGPELAHISVNNDYLRSGANILMHDRYWTRDALPAMIEGYRQKGYHIVDPYLIKHQENSTAPLEEEI